jgi:endosialidase-like protein
MRSLSAANFAWRVNGPLMAAAFIEGRIGENDFDGIWGGLRFYFGQKDKTLIQRHRQDDPIEWVPETLFSIVNNGSTLSLPPVCVDACDTGDGSDVRLKRDIVLLVRLNSGIGLYRYRYLWSDTVYVGVMAQEVATIVPAAVLVAPDGYLRVNYARLGMRLLTWDEWVRENAGAIPLAA